ncbi:MAG: thymidylate kinase-like protein [Anaerolineae bacterium]|jgi:thymidylate kinase
MDTASEPRTTAIRLPAFIYLTGADGTGKSTQAGLLLKRLDQLGVPCRHLWLRFPFLLSLPLLAYARWQGFSWHEQTGGVDHGYWDFRPSWLLRRILPLTVLADAALASLFAVYVPLWAGTTIVCERYVLDMMVDLSLATGMRMVGSWALRSLVRLLPARTLVIGLTAPECLVASRRWDLQHDRTLGAKLAAYEEIFEALQCPVVSVVAPISQVHDQLFALVSNTFHGTLATASATRCIVSRTGPIGIT